MEIQRQFNVCYAKLKALVGKTLDPETWEMNMCVRIHEDSWSVECLDHVVPWRGERRSPSVLLFIALSWDVCVGMRKD